MRKKRIIIDCETMEYPHTGLFHYCLHLGLSLKKLLDPEKEEIGFYITRNTPRLFGDDVIYIGQKKWDKKIMPLRRANIWHAAFQSSRYFPTRKGPKIVLTVHDLNILHEPDISAEKIEKELKRLQEKISRADHIIAISAFTKSDILKHMDTGKKKISVIHNGCNFEELDNITPPVPDPGSDFLFTVGFINKKKNFHVLPFLLVGNKKKLIIAGVTDSATYKKFIADTAQELGVADRVIFAGPVSENDKQWYMKHCEAFVFPSLAEGFGLPVIEAMYFGKPVILSPFTSLPEIGGNAAYYFKDFEPESMRKTLDESLHDYASDANAVQRIKEHAAVFTWKHAALQYLHIYRSFY